MLLNSKWVLHQAPSGSYEQTLLQIPKASNNEDFFLIHTNSPPPFPPCLHSRDCSRTDYLEHCLASVQKIWHPHAVFFLVVTSSPPLIPHWPGQATCPGCVFMQGKYGPAPKRCNEYLHTNALYRGRWELPFTEWTVLRNRRWRWSRNSHIQWQWSVEKIRVLGWHRAKAKPIKMMPTRQSWRN